MKLWKDYADKNQTLSLLAEKNKTTISTIRRRLNKIDFVQRKPLPQGQQIVVVLDTVYWGRNFGLMVFKEANKDKVLYWQYVKYETISLYLEGLRKLKTNYEVKAVVCDGRLLRALSIPTQLCHFHQMAIITRYLTRNPKLQASIELKKIVADLPKIKKEIFRRKLQGWHKKWEMFLNEKTLNGETGRLRYTHRRLRSAFRSLERNFEYLFYFPGLS